LPPKEFKARATRGEAGFTLAQTTLGADLPASLRFPRYQDPFGRLPLSAVDPDARWSRVGKRAAVLGYKEHLIVDPSGFILARRTTPADVSDTLGVEGLLDRLPFLPRSLCGDSGYRSLRLRFLLGRRGIDAYMPLHPHETDDSALLDSCFDYHGDHLICKAGKTLRLRGMPNAKEVVHYLASEGECRACPKRTSCLAPKEKAKCVAASRYHLELLRARKTLSSSRFGREMKRRLTAVEGVFARLDNLAFDEARLRTTAKVDIQGSIAALAHNILKALTKRRFWKTVAAFGTTLPGAAPRPASPHHILASLFPLPSPPPSPALT
jgi:IS5 family transposase